MAATLLEFEMDGHTLQIVDFPSSKTDIDLRFKYSLNGKDMMVTCRDVRWYRRLLQVPITGDLQYVEVGAGLGGLVPSLVRAGAPKPVVIDPVDYGVLERVLSHALCRIPQSLQGRADELIARARLLQDAGRVRHVRRLLGEAVKDPSLMGVADAVVDFYGPCRYAHTKHTGLAGALDLERLLLKPSGRLHASQELEYGPD